MKKNNKSTIKERDAEAFDIEDLSASGRSDDKNTDNPGDSLEDGDIIAHLCQVSRTGKT